MTEQEGIVDFAGTRFIAAGIVGKLDMDLAGAKYRVRRPALAGAAMDMAGIRQVHRDAAGNAAQRLAPADNARNRLLVHG